MMLALMLLFAAGPMEDGFVPLFNGKDLSEWSFFFEKVGPNKDGTMSLSDVCTVVQTNVYSSVGTVYPPVARDAVIRCKTTEMTPGKGLAPPGSTVRGTARPWGFIMTKRSFTNFTLKLQWRFPNGPGMSGVFVRTQDFNPKSKSPFPDGVEAEMNECPDCSVSGDIWFIGNYPTIRCDACLPGGKYQLRWKDATRGIGKWNDYEITVYKDTISLTINGEPVNEFKGIPDVPGHILLQIEGGTFEVRDLRIKELK